MRNFALRSVSEGLRDCSNAKPFWFTLLCHKTVEKSSEENLKVIKNLCQVNQESLKASKNDHTCWKVLQIICT